MLNNLVTEPIRKHLPGQRWDRDTRRLALENIAEVLEIGVATPHGGGFELEGRNVGPAEDFVGGVHGAADAMGLGVAYLEGGAEG